jgi:hypothetical protein
MKAEKQLPERLFIVSAGMKPQPIDSERVNSASAIYISLHNISFLGQRNAFPKAQALASSKVLLGGELQ